MLRRLRIALAVAVALMGGAAVAEIDLKDFDDDLMRDMDTAIKDLEPVLGAKNSVAATGDAELLRDGFKQTEDYFVKKGTAPDAVDFARRSQELTATVLKSITSNDFDAAGNAARALSKSCKSCHDVYKPLTK
jgi:cytochrome c556